MNAYMPFKIEWTENGHQEELLAPNMKRALSLARPLAKRGHTVSGYAWNKDGQAYYGSSELQAAIDDLPTTDHPRQVTGSIPAYNHLVVLSAVASTLAPIARKRELRPQEELDLMRALSAVCQEFAIDLTEPEDSESSLTEFDSTVN